MKKGPKPERPRTASRREERAARELVRDRERLVEAGPGGAPERAIVVETPAVIEGRVSGTPCVQCAGSMRVDEHGVKIVGGVALRVVRAHCLGCRTPRVIWFRIERPLVN